jgi:hypothetical protein
MAIGIGEPLDLFGRSGDHFRLAKFVDKLHKQILTRAFLLNA